MTTKLTPEEKRALKLYRRAQQTADLTGKFAIPAELWGCRPVEMNIANDEVRWPRLGITLTGLRFRMATEH